MKLVTYDVSLGLSSFVSFTHVIYRNSNGYTYFFKNKKFYRFNPRSQSVDSGFPRYMKDYWSRIPENIDAAFTWCNGGIYFFKDKLFWFYEISVRDNNMIEHSYPKSITVWWNDLQHFTGYSVFR